MKYVSVCAGIEAAMVAWHPLGWEPVLFSEIEPFPCAVLKHHYPTVPLVGDFTQLILDPPEADLLVGGTPCQAFSVAGKRLSLEDYRGNLSLAFADLFHAGAYRWAVWENVPGVLSTKDNAFGCLLGRLVGADAPLHPSRGNKWTNAGVVSGPLATAAWRVLDAQYFGVAQRRRRVFVCVSRGAGNWAAAAALLPVGESVSRHPPTRPKAGEGTARTFETGPGGGRISDVSATLDAKAKDGPRRNQQSTAILAYPINTQIATRHEALGEGTGFGIGEPGDPAFTLQAGHSHGVFGPVARSEAAGNRFDGETETFVVEGGGWPAALAPTLNAAFAEKQGLEDQHINGGAGMFVLGAVPQVFAIQERAVSENPNNGPQGSGIKSDGTAYTLEARHHAQAVFALQNPTVEKEQNGVGVSDGPMYTLESSRPHGVVAPTLSASNNPSRSPQSSEVTAQVAATVSLGLRPRRLTPRECERLQGFPDDYTLIPWKKGTSPDGPRYKALGNSMAVPVMHYIGKRIQLVEDAHD